MADADRLVRYVKATPDPVDQTVIAFDSGPDLVVPAADQEPSVLAQLAFLNPGGNIFSPNQFSSNGGIQSTPPTAPVQTSASTSVPHLIMFLALAGGAYLYFKRKK